MNKTLKISVMKDRYPTSFCTLRRSRHIIKAKYFIPTHRISNKIESATFIFQHDSDLIHTVNRIPLFTGTPFVISFESHLPRCFGAENGNMFAKMSEILASSRCRRIIAYSEFAKKTFLATHAGSAAFPALSEKLVRVYPNLVLPGGIECVEPKQGPLKLLFVGGHFGRKGGAVAARVAEIALAKNIPIHVHIVSALIVGRSVWTDPWSQDFFDPYVKLLNLPNITFDRSLPNSRVMELLKEANFSILATLSDTFGFSAIESLSVGTPVIATSQGALPEFIADGINGLLIPLATDPFGEWIHVGRSDKESRRFAYIYREEIERLAAAVLEAVTPYCHARSKISAMRRSARQTAELHFDTDILSPQIDQIYDISVTGDV